METHHFIYSDVNADDVDVDVIVVEGLGWRSPLPLVSELDFSFLMTSTNCPFLVDEDCFFFVFFF